MSAAIKLCGLSTPEAVNAALSLSGDYIGFVLHASSPRNVALAQAAALSRPAKGKAKTVAVLVEPDDALLAAIARDMQPDYFQLHGNVPQERIAEIRQRLHIPIIRGIRVANASDLPTRNDEAADLLLFDAKSETAHGGTGISFDWKLLKGKRFAKEWFLSGGLNAGNVIEALHITGGRMVDVSSGIESAPGVKDTARMREFVSTVRIHGI